MRTRFTILLLLTAPRAALACPVCFGQNDSPMASAANLSILAMLAIVGGVLAGFASFFIHLARRARMVAEQGSVDGGPSADVGPADAPRYTISSEGTAQC